MEIPIGHRHTDGMPPPPVLVCNAEIPLCFLKKLKNPAIKKLAELEIYTIEDLHFTTKEIICDHIRNRVMRRTILAVKQDINRKAFLHSNETITLLDKKIRDKNIRISVDQREYVIAVYLFAKILADINKLLKFLLNMDSTSIPFRQKALIARVYDISIKIITKNAA